MTTTGNESIHGGRFEILVEGQVAGFIPYERFGTTVSFLDTVTDLRLAGQGLGLTLVRKALDVASANGLRVLPVDPFVRGFIRRHPVYLDLVPPDQRERFGLPPAG
jgi:predicted GNAT family acetyltransferase